MICPELTDIQQRQSAVFHGWLEDNLIPKLPPTSVLVMDNATFHKRSDTKNSIRQAGHFLEYLPPYSPDYNPIEKNGGRLTPLGDESNVPLRNFLLEIRFESF